MLTILSLLPLHIPIHPYRSSILLFQGSPWNIYTRYIIYIHQATQHKITTLSPLTHSSQLYSTYIYHHSAHLFFNTILLFEKQAMLNLFNKHQEKLYMGPSTTIINHLIHLYTLSVQVIHMYIMQ